MYEFYVSIEGATQGALAAEVQAGPHAGKLIGLAYEQASSVPATGSGTTRRGRVVHQPVRFTKQWGSASPQLLQALATGEALTSVLFEFIRSTDEGIEEVFHRVRLHDARVVELRPFVDLDAEPSALMPLPPLEEVALSFAGITVENIASGIVATAGTVPAARRTGTAAAPRKAKTAAKRRTSR